jgi:hypothetical protein
MRLNSWAGLAVLALFGMATPSVWAFEAFGMIAPISLTGYPVVQDEIGTTEEQLDKLQPLNIEASKEYYGMIEGLFKGTAAEQQAKKAETRAKTFEALQKVSAKYRPKLLEILNEDQVKRLEQISFQTLGEKIYTHPMLAERLNLSKEQQAHIAAIDQEFLDKMKEFGGLGGAGGNLGERMAKANDLQRRRVNDLRSVLTTEQQEQFDKLKGEEFDVKAIYLSKPAPPRPKQ